MSRRWSLPAGFALVTALTIVGPSGARDELLPGTWTEVRSEHFLVLGNAKREVLEGIASDFERIRKLFRRTLDKSGQLSAGPPLRVFVARDEDTLRRLVPSIRKDLGGRIFIGVFSVGTPLQFAIMRAPNGPGATAAFVYRGYFQYLTLRLGRRLPTWLLEGLSDLWSNVRFEEDATEVGRPISHYLAALDGRIKIDFERLLRANSRSPEYREKRQAAFFCAESWALVHYLTLGDLSGGRNAQLEGYIEKVHGGADPLDAARESFGDLDRLEAEVSGYLKTNRFRVRRLAPVLPPPPARSSAREVAVPEVASAVGLALLQGSGAGFAAPFVNAAMARAPELATTKVAAALLALRENRLAEAARRFEEATAAAEPGPIPYYGLASVRIAQDPTAEELGEIERLLLKAIELDPGFAPAHARLADVHLRRPGGEPRALDSIREAQRLAPFDEFLDLREANLLARIGQTAAARARVSELVSAVLAAGHVPDFNNFCWFGSLYGFAAEALAACDRAVESDPKNSISLDSRALARALAGDLPGAGADLRTALAIRRAQDDTEFVASRTGWLEALERGENPISPALVDRLLGPAENWAYWGH